MCASCCISLPLAQGGQPHLQVKVNFSDTHKDSIWELGMQGLFIGSLALCIGNSLTQSERAAAKYIKLSTLLHLDYKEVQEDVG